MGVRFDRLRYEVFQNLFLSPMNTGSVRPAVATTPTACGIETLHLEEACRTTHQLQQHLPLAVLKQAKELSSSITQLSNSCNNTYRLRY